MLHPWIYPLPLGLLLVVIGGLLLWLHWRIVGAALAAIAVIGLYLLSTPAVSDVLVARLEQRYGPLPAAELPATDAIVVLGGGVSPPAWPRRGPDLGDAADRLWYAAAAYRAGKAALVITTGARPYANPGDSAATAARDVLTGLGVPADAIVPRDDSTSTRDDVLAVRDELERRELDSVLLVTSALHMQRALAAFRAAEVRVWPAPTDHQSVQPARREAWSWLPYPWAFERSNRAWHEYAGLLYYRLRGWA